MDEVASDPRGLVDCRAMTASEPLALGPIMIARHLAIDATPPSVRRPTLPGGEFVAMYFPLDRDGRWAGDVHLAADVAPPITLGAQDFIALLAPYRFLAGILPSGPASGRLPLSIGLNVLQRYLDGLLTLDRERLCHLQTDLAANAIRSLLAAALLPAGSEQGLASRRRASLLDRIVTHVDANLLMSQSADSLCAALGCSRSALYRATAEVGGADELILRRRLIAIRTLLCDPAERRAISEIAQAYCFSDTAQFNRRFKALFGCPPGEFRRRAIAPEAADRYIGSSAPRASARRSSRHRSCN